MLLKVAVNTVMPIQTLPGFSETLKSHELTLGRTGVSTVQVNIGLLCNLACRHCHVESSPRKTKENMDDKSIDRLIHLLQKSPGIKTLDLTGGAPEMHPRFRDLVQASRAAGKHVIDRCNLTVLELEGQEDTDQFLKENEVEIIASLPCYTHDRVDFQRGTGVFDGSVKVLRRLNQLGFGKEGSGLVLDLVFNPIGAVLPGNQEKLEADYKRELLKHFGIVFNRLYTITNMAIKRFAQDLKRKDKLHSYQQLLVNAFNPATVAGLMCRDQVNINWQGHFFDCDFNHALGLGMPGHKGLWAIESFDEIGAGPIAVGDHCFGCTAGAGSSCQGAVI